MRDFLLVTAVLCTLNCLLGGLCNIQTNKDIVSGKTLHWFSFTDKGQFTAREENKRKQLYKVCLSL